MFVAMGLIYRYVTKQPFSFTIIAKEFIYWMLAGLIYGILIKLFFKYIKKEGLMLSLAKNNHLHKNF